MSANGAAPADGQAAQGAQGSLMKTILRSLAIYGAVTYFTGPNSPFRGKQDAPAVAVQPLASGQQPDVKTTTPVVTSPATTGVKQPQLDLVPLWPEGSVMDVLIKLSTAEDGNVDFTDTTLPSVEWKGISYSNDAWTREWETVWDVPTTVQRNASIWADLFITLAGVSPDPASPSADPENTLHLRKILTRFMPKVKVREVKNLLAGGKVKEGEEIAEAEPEVEEGPKEIQPIIAYYHPNVTFQMVTNGGEMPYSSFPEPLQKWITIAHPNKTNAEGKGFYFPVTWANDFWLLREHMNPINETTTQLPLHISLSRSAFWKFQLLASLDDSFNKQSADTGKPGDLDVIKRTLTDTNPILLITTALVTALHALFEILAFTSDVSHWRNKKNNIGVSLRTILTNVFVQLIILLYLVDNNENTSWMILGSQGMGLVIEAWKINKVIDIRIVPDAKKMLGYKLEITDKHVLSEEELATQEADQLAFKWVSWGTAPLLLGYTIYSLVYNEHRGWYSFTITTLTSFVYAFGFVQLIPQLIINWKLKSVAHIPMKAMTYKFLTTIVDDFFSFVISMPILHRLACFRDDVVFVILLYQMWIYKVDPTRINEYGQQLSPEEAAKLLAENETKEKIAAAAAAAGKGSKTPVVTDVKKKQ